MLKELDYHSSEYDELLRQARRIGWNDDRMSSDKLEKERDNFNRSLDRNYFSSDEVDRIKRASRGESY